MVSSPDGLSAIKPFPRIARQSAGLRRLTVPEIRAGMNNVRRVEMKRTDLPTGMLVLAALLATAGCSRFGISAKVEDMSNDRYNISMSQSANDPVGEIEKAARETCPKGYKVLRKGASAESLYGSWLVQCLNPG
jgi:hypothetical protein